MAIKALGLIEVRGLTAAAEVADAAAKTADVTILGYEVTKGSGRVVVKISGDVSAVTVAVHAAAKRAAELSAVVASHVIARPNEEILGYFS